MFGYILCYIAGVGTLILGIGVGVKVTMKQQERSRRRPPQHGRAENENAPRRSAWYGD